MAFTIEKLTPKLRQGVTITGLTPADLQDEATRQQLRDLWIEHGIVYFRSEVTPEFHVELSSVFGDLEAHPVKEYQLEGNPKILNVEFDPEKTDIWKVNGEVLGAWLPWHSDASYVVRNNHGGILRPEELPGQGGATGFIDKIEAYDALPQDVKDRIENLSVVYKMRIDPKDQPYVAMLYDVEMVRSHKARIDDVRARQDRDFPWVVHPLVYKQEGTGRKVLNLSPSMAMYIHGMDPAESHELLSYLAKHIANEERAYFHTWSHKDEMVLWDNWRMLHCACGVPADRRRVVYRTTIAGDYAMGMTLDDFEKSRALADA